MTNKHPARYSIGLKVYSIAIGLLLLMFCIALASLYRINRVNLEVTDISKYDIPLVSYLTNINISNLRQQAQLEKILDFYQKDQAESATADEYFQKFDSLGLKIREQLRDANHLIEMGLKEVIQPDKVELALLQPMLSLVEQSHYRYEDIGLRAVTALRQQNVNALNQLWEILEKERATLDIQIADALSEIRSFTQISVNNARKHQRHIIWFNLVLTLLSAAFGLIGGYFLAMDLVRPIRRLLRGTVDIGKGNLDIVIPETSKDEIGALTHSFNHMASEIKLKNQIKSAFDKYVDPRIVDTLLKNPDSLNQDGDRQQMTVLFCDIEGFTQIGERLTPSGLVKVVNKFLTLICQPINKSGGVVDKFIGDAVMAYWGPPFTSKNDHATASCLAALEMFEALNVLAKTLPEVIGVKKDVPEIRIRVGIATGEVILGNIGSETTKSFTVIGDTVNLASRLESSNNFFSTRLLVNEQTQSMIVGTLETREVDSVRVSGKTDPVRIFEVLGRKGHISTGLLFLKSQFELGLAAYRKQDWDIAKNHLVACQTRYPMDGPTLVLIERLQSAHLLGLSANWDGVWTLPDLKVLNALK